MTFSGKIKVNGTKKELEPYFNALKPDEEAKERVSYKVKLSRRMMKKDYELIVSIVAKDFVAFRAISTSILSVMAIVDKTLKISK